jgi:lipopolysaccharide export system permease protein
MREAIIDIGGVNPVAVLETGRWIRDFPGHRIYLGERNGDTFNDISIFKVSDSGVEQSIRAGSGTVKIVTENGKKTLRIDLYDVHGNQNKSGAGDELGGFRSGFSKHIPIDIPMDKLMKRAKSEMKTKERTVVELISAIGDMRAFFPLETVEWLTKKRIRFIVETNKRMALSIACFAFTLLGVPLGITSRRKESSIGIGISILLVFIFYFFIILAESMLDRPRWHPELIIWIPVVLAELGGFALIRRIM